MLLREGNSVLDGVVFFFFILEKGGVCVRFLWVWVVRRFFIWMVREVFFLSLRSLVGVGLVWGVWLDREGS